MGCFNVACSISDLSIGVGEKVMFIPLLPPRYLYDNFKGKIAKTINNPSSMLIYSNCFFDPFCLPIEGVYDDYGGIEDVKEDDNTEAIKNFLGCSAVKLVDMIGDDRSINDRFGSLFKGFSLDKEAITDYTVKFDEVFLERVGFVPVSNSGWYDYALVDLPYLVYFTKNQKEISFTVVAADWTKTGLTRSIEHGIEKKDFLNIFFKFTGYHPNVAKKDQKKVNMISSMSGMFVHKEIYDGMLNSKDTFGDWGAKETDFETIFEDSITKMKKLDAKAEEYGFSYDYEIKNLMFKSAFRDWSYFMDLYKESLRNGKLKNQIIDYLNFRILMYSANKFFFPAMNGEQHGNTAASIVVADKTSEILKNRLHTCSECCIVDHNGTETSETYGDYTSTSWKCRECLKHK